MKNMENLNQNLLRLERYFWVKAMSSYKVGYFKNFSKQKRVSVEWYCRNMKLEFANCSNRIDLSLEQISSFKEF